MCTKLISYAKTGIAQVDTANPNLNGTGSVVTVLTGTNKGTSISSIFIKAIENTTEGMVRLFVFNASTGYTMLFREIYIPATTTTAVEKAFETTVLGELTLSNGDILYASTQNSEKFNVVANGVAFDYCPCGSSDSVCCSDTQAEALIGAVRISEGNEFLDGSGTTYVVISVPPTYDGGIEITNVAIKSIQSTSQGMVRLFIQNGAGIFLIKECEVNAQVQTSVEPAFRSVVSLNIRLEPNCLLLASTQYPESFNVIVDGIGLANCPCPEVG